MTHIGRSPPGHTPVTVKKARDKMQQHNNDTMKDLGIMKDDRGRTQMPGVRLWGHRINLAGGDGISCEECEMSEEIPDLLQMTSGFRQVLWKMYILGQFKHTSCKPEYETDNSVLHTTTNIGYDAKKLTTSSGRELDKLVATLIPQNQRITVAGENWEHDGHGTWHSHDSGTIKKSGEMKQDFGKEFTLMLPMAITHPQDDMWQGASLGSNRGGVDHSAGRSTDIKGVHDRSSLNIDTDDEEKKSLKEKFVSALSIGDTTVR